MILAGRVVGRGLLLVAAGSLAAWSLFTLHAAWGLDVLPAAAARIMAGEVLRPEALTAASAAADTVLTEQLPPPDLLRAAAFVRVRAAEAAVAAGRPVASDEAVAQAEAAVRTALTVLPADGFLWFALAWLGKTRDGLSPAVLPFLAASYRAAPREGWLALHRDALAVTILPALPAPLQDATRGEFRDLVTASYLAAAADILAGPGWGQRDTLLAALAPLPDDTRAAFAQQLAWKNIDADVPGIVRRRDRPWR